METNTLQRPPRIPRNPKEALERAEASCTAWNRYYTVGTRVRVYRLLGDEASAIDTTTTSEAWVMGGHSAMVMVHGLSGGHALTHVKPHQGATPCIRGERAGALRLNEDIAATIAAELESGVVV